jgi:PAS domain S-box-containing protein
MSNDHEVLDSTRDGHPTSSSDSAGLSQSSGENAQGRDLIVGEASIGITELRQAEEALVESEERFRQMADNFEDVIWITDRDIKKILYINPAYEKVFGRSRESLYECLTSFAEAVHPDDLARMERMLERQRHGDLTPVEYRIIRPDGSVRWMLRRSFPIRNKDGEVYRLAGIAQDITERRRVQEELRESEERYRELFENARDAIYVHDLGGRYTSVNRAAEELSGYRREEIIGRHYSNFVAPDHLKYARESFCQKLDETLETTYEAEIISKNGRRTPVEISSRMIYENGVPVGIQGTARDISERKQTQEALRVYSRALIEAQENERQNIARELHDEIGQVLTAVRINLEAIRGSCQTDACMPHIEDSIAVVDEALVQVRELSLELRPSQLDSLGLSAALRWYVDRYAQRTGIAADVRSIPRDQRLRREVETACFRIVQEALTNVARHAKATRVTVHLKKLRGNLMLSVKDNGVGFDREILGKSSAERLGLLGMEERAHSVGGSIEIKSEALRGTQIRAAFPLEVGSGAQ